MNELLCLNSKSIAPWTGTFLRRYYSKGFVSVQLLVLGLFFSLLEAQTVLRFDVPRGAATKTLKLAAEQAEIDLMFSSSIVENVKTKPLKGRYTVQDAFARLLEGTDLAIYEDTESSTYAIVATVDSSDYEPIYLEQTLKTSSMTQETPQRKNPFGKFLAAFSAALLASTPSGVLAQEEDPSVYDLSPFTVDASEDSGYLANSTLAGTRIKSDLKDIGTSIQVVTSEFLEDTGATNINELLIYTTNTETGGSTGNFSGVSVSTGRTDTGEARASPQSAQRIRGLFTADLTRDYFLTSIPFDDYNTTRIEINRGSNAILFGLGSPAGIINNGLIDAQFDDFGSIKLRFGEKGSHRSSFDFNKEIVEGKLAIRVAGLIDNRKYLQEPAFEDSTRFFATTTWRPFENTTIRAHFEDGQIDANRPDVIAPKENISGWLLAGKPIYDARIGLTGPTGIFLDIDGDGTVEEAPPELVAANNARITMVDVNGRNFNEGNFFLAANGQVDAPNFPIAPGSDKPPLITQARFFTQPGGIWADTNSVGPSMPGVFGSYPNSNRAPGDALDADGQVEGHNFWSVRNLDAVYNNYNRQGFTSIEQFDFGKNLLVGSASFQNEEFDNTNFVLEQTFMENKLGFELAFDRQTYTRESFTPFQDNAGNIYVDINAVLPDGRVNPNLGRPYVDARSNKSDFQLERDTVRATAYYDLNFTEIFDEGWGSWLGRHLLTAFYNTREDEQLNYSSRMAVNDPQILRALNTPDNITTFNAMLNPLMYVGDSLLDITSMDNLPMTRLQRAEIFRPGTTVPMTFWDPGVQPGTNNRPATNDDVILAQGQLVTKDIPLSQAFTGATLEERSVDSYAAIAQSYWLNNHLVSTVGYRKDEIELTRFAGAPRDEVNSMVVPRIRETTPDVVIVEDDRWSWGVVGHWPEGLVKLPGGTKLSFHYSESSNFQAQAGRVDFRNRPLTSPTGETEERGFTISSSDNKFVARVNWFDTVLANRSSATNLFGELVGNAIWQNAQFLFESAARTDDPELARLNRAAGNQFLKGVLPGEDERERPVIIRNDAGEEISVERDAVAGSSDTEDVAAEGMEIELIYNPLPNWRIALNVARQQTVRSNVLPITETQLIPHRLELYQRPVPGFEWLTLGQTLRGGMTEDNVLFDPATQTLEKLNPGSLTHREWLEQGQGQGNLIGFRTAKAAEGATATEQREWRFNLVTHYDFREGRLNGIGVGGAVRWQDRAAIGFPFVENEDGLKVGDVFNPYFDDKQTNFDFWVRYNVPLFEDTFDWVVQLNVRNAFTSSNEIIPIQAQPDGSLARVRFAPQRTWFITSEFKF